MSKSREHRLAVQLRDKSPKEMIEIVSRLHDELDIKRRTAIELVKEVDQLRKSLKYRMVERGELLKVNQENWAAVKLLKTKTK